MMDKIIKDSFITAVRKQAELYAELVQVASSVRNIIVSKNPKGLEDTAIKQEKIMAGIMECENEKKVLFEKMAKNLGLKVTPELKLQDVLTKAGDGDAADIDMETAKLVMLINENVILNSGNARLMKNYLDFLGFTADLKEKMENPVQPIYTPEGAIKNSCEKKTKFDQKI